MRIALLPLDDRPCNFAFPQKLAAIGGIRLEIPPAELLGRFRTPGDGRGLAEWIVATASTVDVLIASVDMLAYGGLVASRTPNVGVDEALGNLSALRKAKAANPSLKTYAFNIIMRLSISATDEEMLRYWALLHERCQVVEEPRGLLKFDDVPRTLLMDFIAARERNHAVNLRSIEMVDEGIIDYLVLPQEDAAERGLHKTEQERLRAAIARSGTEDRVAIHNGTDEAALVLLARALNEWAGESPRVDRFFSRPGGEQVVALYEDRTVGENIAGHVRAIGGRLAPAQNAGEGADLILAVHTPEGRQRDLCMEAPRGADGDRTRPGSCGSEAGSSVLSGPQADGHLDVFVSKVSRLAGQGRLVGVLDIAYGNGGDADLIDALTQRMDLCSLSGYAGWNTASNALGTVLSQISIYNLFKDRPGAEKANLAFTVERLLDDYLYQAVVRRRINDRLEALGIDRWNLGEDLSRVEGWVAEEMDREIRAFATRLSERSSRLAGLQYHVNLPWPRTFEVSVDVCL